jgi:hypothetical protein
MKKQLKPGDGRLKANRDWNRFMARAVHIPSMQRKTGKLPFVIEPEPALETEHERIMRAIRTRSVEGVNTSDLTVILVHAISAAHKIAENEEHGLRGILEFASRAADRLCTIVALREGED